MTIMNLNLRLIFTTSISLKNNFFMTMCALNEAKGMCGYNEKKYVRISTYYLEQTRELSNGVRPIGYEDYWLEVASIPWFVDLDKHKLISKYCLASGVPISFKNYKDVYKNSFMKEYLEKYLTPEIIPSQVRVSVLDDNPELKKVMLKDFRSNRKYW